MRGYLIDTNVISEYNREQVPHAGVVKWLDTTPEALQYVSVLTLAEIEKGILPREEGKRRQGLAALVRRRPSGAFCERILAFDTGCVRKLEHGENLEARPAGPQPARPDNDAR